MIRQSVAPILGNPPGSFAWTVFHQRHPVLIEQLTEAVPYPPEIRAAMNELLTETVDGVITPLDRRTHDHDRWSTWCQDYLGQRWTDVPFLWAESYFYRRLLHAVRYFHPGPWFAVDPFEPLKTAELNNGCLDTELATLDHLLTMAADEQLPVLLHASLWGNRADLGFALLDDNGPACDSIASRLVSDGTAQLLELLAGTDGELCLVTDNAARELIADLVLTDHLLATNPRRVMTLHVKPAPYYVSDATTTDVLACLRRLTRAPTRLAHAGRRLHQAMTSGRLTIRTHPFSCAPLPYHDMPPDLANQFHASALTIMKGDLNYRRLVDDRHWPASTPFSTVTAYFPGPVAVLRTLKSDVVVGLDPTLVAALDASGAAWRTNGTQALIQVRP